MLVLLPVPTLVALIAVPPEKTPNRVVVLLLPTMFVFFTTLLVAPSKAAVFWIQTTAEVVPVPVFVIVKSRVVPPILFEPSIVIKSAPLKPIIQPVDKPEIVEITPDAGLIVTVLDALEPLLALIVNGKISPAE